MCLYNLDPYIDICVLLRIIPFQHEEELCHIPCPGDCILNEWSTWSHCQKNCRIGEKGNCKQNFKILQFKINSFSHFDEILGNKLFLFIPNYAVYNY